MTDHIKTGALGETAAAQFLTTQNFLILDRNVRMPFGEIDIVARDSEGTLIFVEVKTLSHSSTLMPEDNMTRAKFKKLSRVCSAYANSHPTLVDDAFGWRIDLVSVIINPPSPMPSEYHLFDFGKNNFAVLHYKNISLH